MADPRFHTKAEPLSLARLCILADARLATPDLADRLIEDVATLESAGPQDISFFEGRKYRDALAATSAGACLLTDATLDQLPTGVAGLIVAEPQRAFADIIDAFYPRQIVPGVSDHALVDASATLGEGVQIGPGAVIGARAEIGAGTIVGPGAVIEPGVTIGKDGYVGANATVRCAIIGDRVILNGGCHIGHDGYGFVMGPAGHRKLQQLGRVVIGDDVEVGANTAIDRGWLSDTTVGDGTKIDNLVMIGHNCRIGKNCIITGQCGLAGSTTLEDFVVMGAGAGSAGHLTIGAGAMLAGRSGVKSDLAAGGVYGGAPAKPVKVWMREVAALARLGKQGNKK